MDPIQLLCIGDIQCDHLSTRTEKRLMVMSQGYLIAGSHDNGGLLLLS